VKDERQEQGDRTAEIEEAGYGVAVAIDYGQPAELFEVGGDAAGHQPGDRQPTQVPTGMKLR